MHGKETFTGKFITIEGPDGSGKTTQVKFIVEALREKGFEVVQTREPGGTPTAEKIREVILKEPKLPLTETLLFAAARYEHTEAVIKPALREGKIVVCDRYFDSSFAYQAIGRNLLNQMLDLQKMIIGDFEPDITLFFDASLDVCNARLEARSGKKDILDEETREFKELCYEGYQIAFKANPHRMFRIDANQSVEDIQKQIQSFIDYFAIKYPA